MTNADTTEGWHAVRLLHQVPPASGCGPAYEERITAWQCPDASAAMQRAEDDAAAYARASGCEAVAGFAQSYEMYDPPAHGTEAFSLMRTSELEAGDYIDRFFPTDGEIATAAQGAMPPSGWFAVRLLIRFEPEATSLGAQLYEERVSVWESDDGAAAIGLARDEAASYADPPAGEVLDGFAQVYAMSSPPTDGVVVFSATRASNLRPDEYLDSFYDTGSERSRSIDG